VIGRIGGRRVIGKILPLGKPVSSFIIHAINLSHDLPWSTSIPDSVPLFIALILLAPSPMALTISSLVISSHHQMISLSTCSLPLMLQTSFKGRPPFSIFTQKSEMYEESSFPENDVLYRGAIFAIPQNSIWVKLSLKICHMLQITELILNYYLVCIII